MFGMENVEQGHMLFDVLLHLGTLLSVCVAYRKDIAELINELFGFFRRTPERQGGGRRSRSAARLLILLVVATLPLVVIVFAKKYIEKLFYNTIFIGIALIATGVLLFMSDRAPHGKKNEKNATIGNALAVGLMQALAVVPGLSRSGATITGGMFQGFDREFAVKFSFLMSIPAILGANFLSLFDALQEGVNVSLLPAYLVGVIAAAVSGYFAIKLVRYIIKKDRFSGFAYYCWAVGLITIVLTIIV
jgi:undecaprenyl-diphosphatase